MRMILAAAASTLIAACTTVQAGHDTGDAPPWQAGQCDAPAVQDHVGRQASAERGQAILAASGARILRWGPPNAMWTMDYRTDRVNVRYDEAMTITEVTCG